MGLEETHINFKDLVLSFKDRGKLLISYSICYS